MEKENLQENQIRGETVNQQGQFDGMLRNSLMGYEGQSLQQVLPEPPQTFVLECNKVNAQPDGDSYSVDENTGQVDGRPNSWTNTFPPIKLKKGDQVSVNSAFLSSRGGGDLLQFDTTNNKTRMLFEYYSINDKTNGKRSSLDIKGSTYNDANPYELNFSGTEDGKQAYIGEQFNFPANYRPMPLYRLMDTFLTAADFQADPPPTTDTVPFTLPTFKTGTPFYSRLKEANWGYQTGADYILDALEDAYVPGLVRAPKIKINETMFYQDNSEGIGEGTYSPIFGTNTSMLSIWYVATRASLLGPCSEEATMRIYFPFGKAAAPTNFNQSAIDAMTVCKKLRPGDTIQFGNSEAGVGVFAQRAPLKGNQSANGGPPAGSASQLNFGFGTNCYVCSGYAVYSEGHTATSGPLNGQQVDKFTQAGSSESGTGDYDPAWNNPMGMMMKVVRTNIGAFNADNGIDGNRKTGHIYPPAQAANWIQGATPISTINAELDLHATWIEVLCPRAISFCYGDPNYQSVTGMPCLSSSNTINVNGYWSELVDWGNGGVPLEIFCSIPVYSLRTWQTVQRSTMAVLYPFNGAQKPPNIPNMSYLNVSTGNLFPYDKADGKEATQYFLNYVPFFRAVTSDWAASKDWAHTGPWSSLRELQGLPQSEDEYKSKLGLSDKAVSLHAPNYNYTVNSADPKIDSETLVHYGWEMMSTADGYAGARMPREFVGESTDSYQTLTYSTITRNQSFNSGTTMWGWEDLAVEYKPYGNDVLTDSFNFQGGVWGQPNYQTDNRSNRAHLGLRGPTIQEPNPSGDFIIKNANGKAMNFYFSFNIAAGATTDNLDYSGNKPWYNTGGFFPPGTFSVEPSDAEIAADPDFANGSKNFIKAVDNLPPSKFASKLDSIGNPVINDKAGLCYGTLVINRFNSAGGTPTTTDYFIQPGDLDQMDYVNILSQLPTLFYARFYDPHTKASEIMYCAVLTYKVYSNKVADSRTWENSAAYYSGTNLRPPNSAQETVHCPFIVKPNTISTNQGFYYSLPQFHIIQRDVLGEGKKAFGAGSFKFLPGLDGAYFNIVNFYANTSHEISIDGAGRELLNYGEADITKNKQYVASVADTTTQYGLPTGGDFYINTRANLPGTLNGVVEYTGTRLRLNTDTVRTGLAKITQGGNSSPIVTDSYGKMSWNIHYDYIDLELDALKAYYSPSDVGNLITEQLHKPADLYKSYVPSNSRGGGRYDGGTFKNTAGKYPTNSLFRGIHGPSYYQTPTVPAPPLASEANNHEDPKTGGLAGIYREGDFCFFSDVSKSQLQASINAYAWCEGKGCLDGDSTLAELPADGKYIVWPRNRVTKMNIYPMTDSYHIKGYGGAATNPRAVNVLYEEPFDWMDRTLRDIRHQSGAADYEDRYALESTFMSQFIGTNNAALVYNENVSKFEWQYFHQPVYSEYKDIGDGKFVGADIIARIWAQNMDGVDNHDRHGGINVVNWSSPPLEFGGELNKRDPYYLNPLTGKDTVGSAFMEKLGFNQYWQKTNSGRKAGGYPDTAQDDYFPLGTTKSDFDIAQAKPYTQVSNLFTIRNTTARKIVNTDSAYDATGLPTKKATKINLGSLDYGVDNTENSLSGMVATSYGYDKVGSTNTAGTWNSKAAGNNPDLTSTTAQSTYLVNASALQSYAFINTFQTPPSANGKYQAIGPPPKDTDTPFPIAMSNLNLDDVKHPYIEVEVSSSPMRAPELPKKTTIGYFLIMSDLIDRHEFLGSINNGSPLKCLGLLSKNYENNDFFFSFQSPVQFYVKQDRVITSIKTEILTPSLEDPIGLDFNSSVIYTIIRENSVPEPDVAPVSLQQAYDYDIMEQLSGQLGINGANPQALMNYAGAGQGEAQMGGGGFAGLRKEIVQNVLNPSSNSPLQIDMSINSNLQRMSISQRVQLLNTLNTTDAGAQTVGLDNSPSVSEPNPMGELAPFVQTGPIGEKIADGIAQSGAAGEVKSIDTTPNTYEAFTGEINRLGKRDENSTPSHDVSDFDPDFVRQKRLEAMGKRPKRSDSAREQLAEQQSIAQKAAQPFHQVGLTEFYQAYRNTMSGTSKRQWDRAIKRGGVQVEDPRTWHATTLRHWQGIDKDFHWGKSAHKKLGNKQLNLDGRTKINIAYDERINLLKQGKIKRSDLGGSTYVRTDTPKAPTRFKIKHKSGETTVKTVTPKPNAD